MAKSGKKRQPTLADEIVSLPAKIIGAKKSGLPILTREIYNVVKKVRVAEKFVFDADASQRVAEIVRDIPDLIVEQMQFARPPYDITWIEIDYISYFSTLNPNADDPDGTSDCNLGFLINNNRINVIAKSVDGTLGLLPWAYHLNTEWPLQDQINFCQRIYLNPSDIDNWLWGSTAQKMRNQGKHELLNELRNVTMVDLFADAKFKMSHDVALQSGGDFRNAVAFLLILNQPSAVKYVSQASTRGWIGNRPRAYLSHHVVNIHLDVVPQLKKLSESHGGEHGSRIRHSVRGHYCHDHKARNAAWNHTCIHDWLPADEDWELVDDTLGEEINHWLCAGGCEGKRWWRAKHERGDASLGFGSHDYHIHA